MNEEDIRAQLEAEYDRVIKETLQKLYRSKPLNRAKITAALMAANKAYWTVRLALLDNDAVYAAGRVSGALAMSYYYAAEDLAEQVQHVYAGYRSAFHLSQKGAKELLDKVVYDRPIAQSLQRIADAMPAGEERNRILAEISAPAYRYRMQRAEQIAKNAQEACENIARGEIAIDRQFLQTEIEKAYNISLDGALSEPPSGEIVDMLSGDVVLDRPVPAQPLEMPRADEPVQDFTPTDDRGIMDSFSVVSTDHAREIMENRWSGESFSERIWSNTEDLAQEVKQVILEGELTGASEAKMAAKIRDRFTVGMHEARRVVRTEHNYCINQAELKGMRDAGFDEYEFASLGENADDVCHTCDDLDGERFKIEDAVVGVNCPPMHPFCRCKATTPMETKEDVQADIDRLLDGRSIEDIERELDRQIAVQNAPPEPVESPAEATQQESNSTLNSVQESAEENIEKTVDNSEKSGIMESEDEFGYQYGDKAINADIDYINSEEYANRFDAITDNPSVNKALFDCSREAIQGNNGTKHEFMYIINANTGEVMGRCYDSPGESGVVYNEDIKSAIARSKEENIPIIGLHNHPQGLPPSVDDFNKARENGYVFGFIPGHNGQLYVYAPVAEEVKGADIIHENINLLCANGADPDRIYREEYEKVGLDYVIIGDDYNG